MATSTKKSVLFVCLGNICRSPIAEAVFLKQIKDKGVSDQWKVESAGIGSWHVGNDPDSRALATLKKHGVPKASRCRQITKADFTTFDTIFGMDDENISDLNSRAPKGSTAQIKMLGEYDPQGQRIIEDPYYGDGIEGFETVYQQCERCCKAFLEEKS